MRRLVGMGDEGAVGGGRDVVTVDGCGAGIGPVFHVGVAGKQ